MSWLTDIAGRAEDLLNKIDSNAATVLNEKNQASANRLLEVVSEEDSASLSPSKPSYTTSRDYAPAAAPAFASAGGSRSTTPSIQCSPTKAQGTKSKLQMQEDELIQFLNEPETSESSKEAVPTKKASNQDDGGFQLVSGDISSSSSRRNSQSSSSVNGSSSIVVIEPQAPPPATSSKVSASPLSVENQLLKSEVASLSQEMTHILNRAKQAEKALTTARSENLRLSSEIRGKERAIQSLEDKMDQMKLSSQEQLAETSSKYECRLQDLETSQSRLEAERDRLRAQLQAKDSSEAGIREEMSAQIRTVNESIKGLEVERTRLQSQVESLELELSRKDSRNEDSLATVSSLKTELEAARQQHEDYKGKAKRVLAEKENIISSFRADPEGARSLAGDMAELQQATRENDLLRDETVQLTNDLAAAREDIGQLERQLQEQESRLQRVQEEAATAINEARAKAADSESDLCKTKEDLRFLREDFSRQKMNFASALKAKELELVQAQADAQEASQRREMHRRSPGDGHSMSDVEVRLAELTDTLLQKQALLEAVTAEKTSLVLKMERMEETHRNELTYRRVSGNMPHSSMSNSSDDSSPGFLRESPFDTHVARGMKRAYSSIDQLGCKIGATLRRYPMARIFLLAYMSLLHFWVFLILFSAAPEPNNR